MQVRIMEALGIISPSKTPSGWRQYGEADVEAACAWLERNAKPRRREQTATRSGTWLAKPRKFRKLPR